MTRTVYSAKELKDILEWRKNGLTPQRLFGLDSDDAYITYDSTQIKKIYKNLKFRSHPDRHSEDCKKNASLVFNLLEQAEQYLQYTLDKQTDDLNNNIFYNYYILGILPEDALEDKYKNLIKKTCDLKINNQPIDDELIILLKWINEYPNLLHEEYDNIFSTYGMRHKNIFYFAIEWNEPSFLGCLLQSSPYEENVLKKTSFGTSPFDYALYHHHFDILICLAKHFGDNWLKKHLNTYLCSKESFDRSKLIDFYLKQYPEELPTFLNNPILIPGLIQLGIIEDNDQSILQSAMIHCPEVYLTIQQSIRQELSLNFSVALADRFPILKSAVTSAFHRDSPPYNNYVHYDDMIFYFSLILISISLGLSIWYFWPIMLLQLNEFFLFLFGLTILLIPPMMLFSILVCFQYFLNIYPEAQKINSILSQNSIFQVPQEKLRRHDHCLTNATF